MESMPVIAISQCLMGHAVRYDGTDKHAPSLLLTLEHAVRFIPICPEVEAGLGIPRPPMRIELGNTGSNRLVVINSREDHTQLLSDYAERKLNELRTDGVDGFILKARSPSCGKASPLTNADGKRVGVSPGFFVQEIQCAAPELPVADEEELRDDKKVEEFLKQARHCAALRLGTPSQKR